jgi:hypothetical protein
MATESWNTSLERSFEVTRRDLVKDKALKHGAWLSPVLLSIIPALILLIIGLFSGTPPTIAFFFSLGFIAFVGGFILGLIISGGLLYYRQKWLTQMREKIAVDGIKTEEVEWFKHELTTAERKALNEIESGNRMLGDAYRETLASRLTATRIVKSTKKELLLVQRRQNKLKYLKSEASDELQTTLKDDFEKLNEINVEAAQMKIEAETRLQMIEAASRRGTNLAGTELALKKLTARAAELPLALEALKMEDEIRKELEAEPDAETKSLSQ